MIGVEVGLRDVFMAATALRHDFQFEALFISAANGVRRVTIVTDRKRFVRLAYKRGMNALFKLILNSMMTGAAGLRHIFRTDARRRIVMRQHTMSSVTTCTGRRHGESALHQSFAMNALGISLDNLVLCAFITHRCFFTFAMTACAEVRNVRCKDRRDRIRFSGNAMRAMAK